jgi:hypothetical protein
MARSDEMRCAAYGRAGIGLHFRRFATFPGRGTGIPQSASSFGSLLSVFEALAYWVMLFA